MELVYVDFVHPNRSIESMQLDSQDFGEIRSKSTTIPQVYEDFGDIECEVHEDEQFQAPEHYYGPALCGIKFNVAFTIIPSHEQDSDFNFLDRWESLERGREEHIDFVELSELTRTDEESRWVLVELLESIRVPPDQSIIMEIKNCARYMASLERCKNEKIIGMVVNLDILRARADDDDQDQDPRS